MRSKVRRLVCVIEGMDSQNKLFETEGVETVESFEKKQDREYAKRELEEVAFGVSKIVI